MLLLDIPEDAVLVLASCLNRKVSPNHLLCVQPCTLFWLLQPHKMIHRNAPIQIAKICCYDPVMSCPLLITKIRFKRVAPFGQAGKAMHSSNY